MKRAVAIAAVAVLAACGTSGQTAPVQNFSDQWPSRARPYDEVLQDWTRAGKIVHDFDRVLDVKATFMSPDWRAAYVRKRAEAELMGDVERARLTDEQKAADDAHYEVALFVATYRHEENELQKGEKSMWRIVLADDQGNEIRPVEIKRDRRPPEVIRAYFPDTTPRHIAYVARFPRSAELLGAGAGKFSLKMASARGGVELVWTAK